MTRALILGAGLLAFAACSTENHLLAPNPEAARIISPESRDDVQPVEDPVCGATIEGTGEVWHATHQGVDYSFDSEACRKAFRENPDFYSDYAR